MQQYYSIVMKQANEHFKCISKHVYACVTYTVMYEYFKKHYKLVIRKATFGIQIAKKRQQHEKTNYVENIFNDFHISRVQIYHYLIP